MHTFSSRKITLLGLLDLAGVLAINVSALLLMHAQGIPLIRSRSRHVVGHSSQVSTRTQLPVRNTSPPNGQLMPSSPNPLFPRQFRAECPACSGSPMLTNSPTGLAC